MRTQRTGMSVARVAVVLIACLLLGTAAARIDVSSEPEVAGAAGAYATLAFPLEGNGTYRFVVAAPEGWTVVTSEGDVDLEGDGFVSVTVRVPDFAPVGERFAIRLRLLDARGEAAVAVGTVEVLHEPGVAVTGPGEIQGALGMPLPFEVVVANEGNARDTVRLTARHTHWDVRFDPAEVTLDPGERRVVPVLLRPTTTVNSGYRHIFYVAATSTAAPGLEDVTEVVSRFYLGGSAASAQASDRPRITLGLSAGVTAGVEIRGDEVTPSVTYRLRPALGGQMSDYVTGSLATNRFAGSLDDPFEEVPSSLNLVLQGPGWNGALSAGARRYALQAGVDLGTSWRLSGGGAVVPGDLIAADARLENQDLGLQLMARTGLAEERRTDSVAAHFQTELTEELELSVGTDVTGFADEDYRVALGLSQRLTWRNGLFDVSQSYAGVPLAGVHTIGVSGGTRTISPFGVRLRSSYSVSPVTNRWSNSATVYSDPVPGLTLDVTGAVTLDGSRLRSGATWSVSPRLGYVFDATGGFAAGFALRYGHGGVLSGAGTAWDLYAMDAELDYAAFGLAASAEYEVRQGNGAAPHETSLEAAVRAEYDLVGLGADALLFADYGYEEEVDASMGRVRHEFGAGWDHAWSGAFATRLGYERTVDPIGDADEERLSASVGVSDLLLDGLRLNAGYQVVSPTSLLDFDAAFEHDLRIGIGYDLSLAFDTPDPLVDLFGGRRGGEVHGVAFLDDDLDGVRDDGERPLEGITVRVGSDSDVTDAQGTYRLRTPGGEYELAFPAGLPATVDLHGGRTIHVAENERHERPLAFASVVSLQVELFDDRDDDGVRDDGEEGVPFGGLVLEGPQRRIVRTDGSGRALVSGLLTGAYTVSVSADHLPSGYRATTEPVRLAFAPGERPAPVRLGAARPPRTVVRTFTSGALAVLPRALDATTGPGAEIELEALVQGAAERVVVVHPGGEEPFVGEGPRWRARILIPRDTPLGPLQLTVRAEAGEERVERPVFVNVVDRPPFVASAIVAVVEEELEVEVETLFPAGTASLAMPGGSTLDLASEDGYRWSATWHAPAESGRHTARFTADGEELGEVAVSVFPRPGDATASPDVPDETTSEATPEDAPDE